MGGFQVCAVTNKATRNIPVQMFLWTLHSFPLGIFPVMNLLGHMIELCLTLLVIAKQFCKVVVPNTFPPARYDSSVCSSSLLTFSIVSLSNKTHSWYALVVLTYISLMTMLSIFSYIFCPFAKMFEQDFCPYFEFFLLRYMNSLYISSLSDAFIPCLWMPFLLSALWWESILILMKYNLNWFLLLLVLTVPYLRNFYLP